MKLSAVTIARGSFILGILAILSVSSTSFAADERWIEFSKTALSKVEEKPNIAGEDPAWFFPVRELNHLGQGEFWKKDWSEVAANQSDPIPSLIEFRDLLKEKGIDLILLPIPPKGSLYPEKLDSSFALGDSVDTGPFWKSLRERGLDVVNLYSVFSDLRKVKSNPLLYCQQDSHYTPYAIEKIAELVARKAEKFVHSGNASFKSGDEERLTIVGDQIEGSEWEGKIGSESLLLRPVFQNGTRGVEPDAKSPFLLLGDSHTLVFQQGKESGMHTTGAGLVDHLSLQFGVAFDLVGVRGSGMVQARKQLFYRAAQHPGYWENKKLVVWVFSEREFTQSIDRLISIPLER